jgi:hypothetical protein
MTNTTNDTGFVIDTPEGIDMLRVITMRSALKFEVETGMKMTRISALAATNERFGTDFRTKKKALAFLNEVLADFDAAAGK